MIQGAGPYLHFVWTGRHGRQFYYRKLDAYKLLGISSGNLNISTTGMNNSDLLVQEGSSLKRIGFSYTVTEPSMVNLSVFNAAGKSMYTLVNQMLPAGNYKTELNENMVKGNRLPSGVYVAKFRNGKKVNKSMPFIVP